MPSFSRFLVDIFLMSKVKLIHGAKKENKYYIWSKWRAN